MVKYECNLCEFETKNKRNYINHHNTQKHKTKMIDDVNSRNSYVEDSSKTPRRLPEDSNIKDENTCAFCNKKFTRGNNLGRHLKLCLIKKQITDEYDNKIQQLNMKLNKYEQDINHQTEEAMHYKEETEHYKQLLREAGGIVKKSVSALTFAVDNYDGAPAIKTITIKEIGTFDENSEKKIVEDVLSAYKHKTLGKYLGDFIIIIYKKSDPKNQSIWNTDDSRLTYLIKELMSNKASNWIIDKKGIKTKTYLIEPLLIHIKDLLIMYQTTFCIPEIGLNSVEIDFILENSKKIIELVNDIDDGIIGKEVLKHISSHLRFNNKMIT